MSDVVRVERRGRAAWLVLNRPDKRNAFDDELIATLHAALREAVHDETIRAIVLTGEGRSFSAGADLDWMRRMAGYSKGENLRDAERLVRLFQYINTAPKPVIAAVNGAAIAGGTGLVAASDIAIGAESAVFAFSEVRLGLVPATIGPFVIQAIGWRQARRYFLTAERFDAAKAAEIGLLHEVVSDEALEERVGALVEELCLGGPAALGEVKALLHHLYGRTDVTHRGELRCATRLAQVRASEEGREGIGSFLERRKPAWQQESAD